VGRKRRELDQLTKSELIALVRGQDTRHDPPTNSEFRQLVDGSILGIVIHRYGEPLYANQAFADLLGFSSPSEILDTGSILQFFVPENRERVRNLHARRLAGDNVPNVFEHPLIRRDGTEVWIESRISAATWGGVLAVHVAVVDITEKRRVERMKDEFISTVSHELRTPLTSISGALSLIASGMAGVVPLKQRELVEIASNNSDRLVRLVNDILDVQSFESGDVSLTVAPVDADALLEEALELNQPFLQRHNATAAIVARTGGSRALGAHDALIQVLTNLLSNAAKFSDGSPIELSAQVRDGFVDLVIADHGPGVEEDLVPKLFTRFARGHEHGAGGTGLGLYISRNLLEAQGGEIDYVRSQTGSRFTVRLPEAGGVQ
jgi:PAS domain S-box-containing protein